MNYTQRKYSKIDKSLHRHRIFLINLYFQTHLRSFIPIFSSSFHSPLSWSKEKQRNLIGYGRDKRRPLNRITPSIISCTESGRANAFIVDLPSKILPSQKYDTSWTYPLSLGRAIALVQAFSSFPGQDYNNCRRQTILDPLFILDEADAYTRRARRSLGRRARGYSPYNTRIAQPPCIRMHMCVCTYQLTYVHIRVRSRSTQILLEGEKKTRLICRSVARGAL